MTDATQTQPTEQAPQTPGLTVQDLILTLQVIQVASSRGAFKADELSAIGGLHDRVFKFLESTGAITANPPAAATPTPEVTETKTKKPRSKKV